MTTLRDIELTGSNRIGGRESRAGGGTFRSQDPRSGAPGDVAFAEATADEVGVAAALAGDTFRKWRTSRPADRARFLRAAAAGLRESRERIVSIANAETGLGDARLNGELDRTCVQLEAFAELLEDGSYVEAIISLADPQAKPAPRPDVRRMLVPIGPVAVFTPSNFPLAFGVAGGDTASALAAGCPVIVKGHPAHGGTSEACARAVEAAAAATGTPAGVLSLLQSRSVETAQALVRAPALEAIAFTGSETAGRAIHDVAASRPRPIPVYAEMGSVNPLFIGSAALDARAAEIADGLAGSITMGTGQFCTKPGLVFVPDDERGRAFSRELAARVAARPAGFMLYPGLHATLSDRVGRMTALPGVALLTPGDVPESGAGGALARPGVVVSTDVATFLATPALSEEHFGPVSVVVHCEPARMIDLARQLHGNLTATIHAEPAEHEWAATLADALVEHVGRVVWNGYPTGVAVTPGMYHGGPYPASTAPAHTSVGVTAIRRFLRPVAFQNTPDALLPEALQDANPLGIQRQLHGAWTRERAAR